MTWNVIGGVDEAGRGSMIGPIIVAGVSMREIYLKSLMNFGIKDSKLLSPLKRRTFFGKIVDYSSSICICKIQTCEIDKNVRYNNLNYLEARAMATVIDNIHASKIYVDSCDVSPARFKRAIFSQLSFNSPEIISMHRADKLNLVVAAASIIAKVIRDNEIYKLRTRFGNIGSGYPSDKITKRFVEQWFDNNKSFPYFVRKSWKPIKKILNEATYIKLFEAGL
jgi:ribonuclease HII